MAKKNEVKEESTSKLKWYRVLEESFVGDAIRQEGEFVQYRGVPGTNLEEVSEDEVRKSGKQVPEDEKDSLENLRADVAQREREVTDREAKLEIRLKELEVQEEAINEKSERLNEREAALAEREAKLNP